MYSLAEPQAVRGSGHRRPMKRDYAVLHPRGPPAPEDSESSESSDSDTAGSSPEDAGGDAAMDGDAALDGVAFKKVLARARRQEAAAAAAAADAKTAYSRLLVREVVPADPDWRREDDSGRLGPAVYAAQVAAVASVQPICRLVPKLKPVDSLPLGVSGDFDRLVLGGHGAHGGVAGSAASVLTDFDKAAADALVSSACGSPYSPQYRLTVE